jgi:hypothetical protein
MSDKMTEQERKLYFHLLNSPLTPDGEAEEWYRTLCAASRMNIPPWTLSGEEPTPEVRAKWRELALTALQIESDVAEIKRRNPRWFEQGSEMHRWLTEQARAVGRKKLINWGSF